MNQELDAFLRTVIVLGLLVLSFVVITTLAGCEHGANIPIDAPDFDVCAVEGVEDCCPVEEPVVCDTTEADELRDLLRRCLATDDDDDSDTDKPKPHKHHRNCGHNGRGHHKGPHHKSLDFGDANDPLEGIPHAGTVCRTTCVTIYGQQDCTTTCEETFA